MRFVFMILLTLFLVPPMDWARGIDLDRIDDQPLRASLRFQLAGLRGAAADLLISARQDGDGAVTAYEQARITGLLSSGLRARLARRGDTADADDNGARSVAGLANWPQDHISRHFSAGEARQGRGKALDRRRGAAAMPGAAQSGIVSAREAHYASGHDRRHFRYLSGGHSGS